MESKRYYISIVDTSTGGEIEIYCDQISVDQEQGCIITPKSDGSYDTKVSNQSRVAIQGWSGMDNFDDFVPIKEEEAGECEGCQSCGCDGANEKI